MKSKTLWKISVCTLPEADDAVVELLLVSFQHPAATYLDLESGVSTITVYLPKKPDWPKARKILYAGLARIKTCGLRIGAGKISLQKVRRENWAESWKRHFKPLEIGGSLLVKPSWSKRRAKKNQAVIILDPGLSFGTGQHPTTSFCLQQLAGQRFEFRVPSSELKQRPRAQNSKLETRNPPSWTSAPARGFSPSRRRNWDTRRSRLLILTRKPWRLPAPTPGETGCPTKSTSARRT